MTKSTFPAKYPISITNLAERHLRLDTYGLWIHHLGHQISITNLAERHLRHRISVLCTAPQGHISITNLAERHLRHRVDVCRVSAPRTHINHESSRKAFETSIIETVDPSRPVKISITNLAERHLRPSRPVNVCSLVTGEYQSRI